MVRVLNLIVAIILLLICLIPMFITALLIFVVSPGPVIYWSKRVGRNNSLFLMPKFRSMKLETPQVATHLLKDTSQQMISVGPFIRKTSLDELPQLYSIIKGDMNFIGPRPALFNQDDLIEERTKRNVHSLTPGVTGWAQVNGRDAVSILEKTKLDEFYLKNKSLGLDFKILLLTLLKVFKMSDVSH
ncbi:MAG: sugar transferase [Bdellovibrionales bacterium]|nr:sugar transferase [Bdellovibrionales bacterium]